jgi:hypothetical protein
VIVVLSPDQAQVTEADDLGRLHVSTALQPAEVERALQESGIGTKVENGRALLAVDVLHDLAAAAASATTPQWEQGWEKMLSFARSHQWVTDDGRGVWAHVESFTAPDRTGASTSG